MVMRVLAEQVNFIVSYHLFASYNWSISSYTIQVTKLYKRLKLCGGQAYDR
jgi:hypothetical protein